MSSSFSGLVERIHRVGPIPFSTFVDAALYEPGYGFFATGGGAGRAGADFLTSPEVGPLFGHCVGLAINNYWHLMKEPDPFLVIEAGAGNGRLCRDVLRSVPDCAQALRYVLVERSAVLREEQHARIEIEPVEYALGPSEPVGDGEPVERIAGTGPIVTALDALPATVFDGVVIANELLDNLAFDVVERTGRGWDEIRVGVDDEGKFLEVPIPVSDELGEWMLGIDAPVGARLPVQRAIEAWLEAVAGPMRRGAIVLIDYAADIETMVGRGRGWLRTYRAHGSGGDPLEAPGSQDITADVLLEPLRRAARRVGLTHAAETTQADWLRELGIDALVAEGWATWEVGAARGDLEALAGLSRISEATALTDPTGLGAHTVEVFTKGI